METPSASKPSVFPPQITLTMADGASKTVQLRSSRTKGGGHVSGLVPLDDDGDITGSVVKWHSTHPIKNVWGQRTKNRRAFLVGGDLGEGWGVVPVGQSCSSASPDGSSCSRWIFAWTTSGKCVGGDCCSYGIYMEGFPNNHCSGAKVAYCSGANTNPEEWQGVAAKRWGQYAVQVQVRIINNRTGALPG